MNSLKLSCEIVRNQGGYSRTRIENLYKDNKIRSNQKNQKMRLLKVKRPIFLWFSSRKKQRKKLENHKPANVKRKLKQCGKSNGY